MDHNRCPYIGIYYNFPFFWDYFNRFLHVAMEPIWDVPLREVGNWATKNFNRFLHVAAMEPIWDVPLKEVGNWATKNITPEKVSSQALKWFSAYDKVCHVFFLSQSVFSSVLLLLQPLLIRAGLPTDLEIDPWTLKTLKGTLILGIL